MRTRIQHDFVIKKKFKKTKLSQEITPKISVEQIKGDEEFYLYLYPLGS
jgi:hypothetical protein